MMSNTTTPSGQQGSFFATQDILFAAFYAAIVFSGVIGNGIIITIVRKTPSMHTTTNYLLMNLAVADLLTLLLCPGLYDFALTKVRLQGFLGDVICKLFAGNAVVPITINVAVLTVCTIAVERYLALVKPFRNLRLTKDSVGYVIALLWLIALLTCVPDIQANTFDIESNKYPCKRPWSLDEYYLHKSFIIFTCVCFGFLSFLIIFICYFEIVRGLYFTQTICSETSASETERHEKKQLARLLIWLAIIFAVCSLPFASFFLYLISANHAAVLDKYETLYLLHRISRFLLFANSFFNPLLYALQSSNYRNNFRLLFKSKVRCCKPFETNAVQNISYRQRTTGTIPSDNCECALKRITENTENCRSKTGDKIGV